MITKLQHNADIVKKGLLVYTLIVLVAMATVLSSVLFANDKNHILAEEATKPTPIQQGPTQDPKNIEVTPTVEASITPKPTKKPKPTPTPVTAEVLTPNSIVIPKIGVNVGIIKGTDGNNAIEQGAWLYPSSYDGSSGEKIFLGHRRKWGPGDPRSFWNLNQLEQGDTIKLTDATGTISTYSVTNTVLTNGGDYSILKASKDNIIKLISCSTAYGTAGSSEKRIVIIATKIS